MAAIALRILPSAILLLSIAAGVAQPLGLANAAPDVADEFVGRVWQVEHGLPQNSVMAILQSRDGYLWIGTANGLARFDGVRFKLFGLADGLPSLQVRLLMEDRTGGLWVGTGNGLSRYRDGRFTHWTTRDGLAGDAIMALAEDHAGAVWIGTTTGLSRWRDGAISNPELPEIAVGRYVRALLVEESGGVWISFSGLGLMRWDGRALISPPDIPGVLSLPPYCLFSDRAGRFWMGAVGRILCLDQGSWKNFGTEQGLPRSRITTLSEDGIGRLWAGTYDRGLFLLNGNRFQEVRLPGNSHGQAVQAAATDREGNVWVGTRADGLARLKTRRLAVWHRVEGGEEIAPISLAELPDGGLLVASLGRGFYRFDDGLPGRWMQGSSDGYVPFGAMLTGRDNRIWWGAEARLSEWKEGRLEVLSGSEECLIGDAVRCLCEDRDEGLWIGTRGGKLWRYRTGAFTAVTNGLPSAPLTSLVQQPDRTLWIGTYGGGLIRLRDNGHSEAFGRSDGLRSELIRALTLDSKGELWIGTEGGGLSCFREGAILSFGARQGLDDTVVQIVEDGAGHLWLGTFRGIIQVFRRDLDDLINNRSRRAHPNVFGRSEGLLSEQCAVGFGTSLKTRRGALCFSTDRGIAVIDPGVRGSRSVLPDVRLEEVLMDGEPQQLSQARHAAAGDRSGAALVIPPGHQRLDFRFTGLCYSAPELVRFRYRLAGLDSDWTDSGSDRTAPYTHVPPGSYLFEVSAHNGNGVWTQPPAALPVVVQPFFWQTWWFRLLLWILAVVVVSGAVAAVLRRRHRLRLQAVESQRAIERERSRIAQDMHDELGSRLTKASMVAEGLRRVSTEAPALQPRFAVLRETLDKMTVTMDELVWAVNPQHDTLDGLASYIIRFTQEFLADTPINCVLNVPTDFPAISLSAHARHNLFLAFEEALANAAKHASATEISVRMDYIRGRLLLEVEDNGVGFSGEAVREGGHGLENMRQRLQAIGGKCEIKARMGHGTQISFELPLKSGTP